MVFMTVFYWLVLRLAVPVRGFLPSQFRSDIAANADFQKFNDGLMMTLDCSKRSIEALRIILEKAEIDGAIQYGLHVQDEALITCIVPSVFERGHMHFIDGSGGGYTAASAQMRSKYN